jgi:hypothetical protein
MSAPKWTPWATTPRETVGARWSVNHSDAALGKQSTKSVADGRITAAASGLDFAQQDQKCC